MDNSSLPATFKAAVVNEAGKLDLEERPMTMPGPGQVLIKVAACGVCHSDLFTVMNAFPGLELPRVPGHEVVGHVAAVAPDVEWPTVGMLVGVGWHADHCLFCEPCRRGDFMMCVTNRVTGINKDGGYSEYMLTHWTGVAELPEGIDPVEAAPLMCAGVTVFNAMRHQSNVRPGDLVAIQGIGGLGHLGIQFANKMGYRVAAISTSDSKKELAFKLGAHHYISSSYEKSVTDQLLELGGAKLICATAPNAESLKALVPGLSSNGRLLIVGADTEPFPVYPLDLISARRHVCGWPSGIASDSTDTMKFAKLHGVVSQNEEFTLDQAQQAFDHMMQGNPRFRVVIRMDH